MPARVERTERKIRTDAEIQLLGDPTGEYYDVILFFGIIDILTEYDMTKKLEHAYKSIQYDPNSISAVDPKQYSRRFRDYIFKVFAEDILCGLSMAANKPGATSFSRNSSGETSNAIARSPGLKLGPNGTMLLSSGIPDLDKIIGGGFSLGSFVVVMEDPEAPHHMLLLRNFMSQGLVHHQPLIYASPSMDPKGFLGTLPDPVFPKEEKPVASETVQGRGLRIAWQYKKYFDEHNPENHQKGKVKAVLYGHNLSLILIGSTYIMAVGNSEYCCDFDLQKPLKRQFFNGCLIECISLKKSNDLESFHGRCSSFLSQIPGNNRNLHGGRIAVQSLCSPQCEFSQEEGKMVSFVRSLKKLTRSTNFVAVVTFSPSLVSTAFSKRLQHLADTLVSVKAILDEDKELNRLLTGYKDMVGLLCVHKVSRINSQVPTILDANTFSMKLQKRRYLVLECLNQAPVDGSSGSSYASSGSCSGSSPKPGLFDF
ncbi:hypothetical protein M569_04062 [Genlisea aurea]|uniref:Elongator complex protein 4 n=1 Tax=Genlisea aurea TaxID=192259 RepID=S8CTU2_9LAMI|nr:hypothetical protein M569_04062 [Genlisea aurea]